MAASTQQKLDYLLKKIGYTASKTGLAEDSSLSGTKKAPFAESIPSPLVTANTSIWTDSESIPGTPPGSDSSYVKVYLASASGHRMTVDSTVSGSRAFIAYSTYNNTSTAILGDWIDTQFGDSYIIKVYKGDPNSGGTLLSAAGSGSNDTWFFDYASGVLNFNGTVIPSGVTDTNIYIVGYRYIGAKGTATAGINTEGTSTFENIVVNGNAGIGSLNVTGVSTLGITSTTWLEAEQLNVSGISTLNDVSINAGVVTFTNVSSTPSDSLAGGHIYAYDNGLRIVGGSGALRFHSAGFARWKIDTGGTFAPLSTDGYDIGSSIYPVSNLIVSGNAGIGSLNVTGVSTLGITSATWLEAEQLDVTGLSTFTGVADFNNDIQVGRIDLSQGTGTKYIQSSGSSIQATVTGSGNIILATNLSGGTSGNIKLQKGSGSDLLVAKGTGEVDVLGDFNVTGLTSTATLNVTGVSTLGITSATWLEAEQLDVSGISTLANTVVGGATTQLLVTGDARVTGELKIGDGTIILNDTGISTFPRAVNIGPVSISTVTATTFPFDVNVGSAITFFGGTGIVSATSFTGIGSNITQVPYTTLTGVTTDIVGDTTPKLGGDLDGDSKSIYGVGVLTATTFDGNLATTNLTGTITNAQLAGSIANDKLSNDSVSYGGVSVDLGASDATPAFDLTDATNYPYTSLTGITTDIVGDTTPTLGGNLDGNSKSIYGVGILTATTLDISGDVDIDGDTELDQINVSAASTFGGLVDIDAGAQANTLKVEDLTNNRIVIAGTGGELEDTTKLTFDGSTLAIVGDATFSGNVTIGGTLTKEDVTNIDSVGLITAQSGVRITAGGLVIASGVATFTDAIDADGGLDVTGGSGLVASTAKISDLTSGRVVVAGTSGELEDASTFTFSGGTVSATNFSGNLTGTLQTAAQTNITSVGTLSAVTVSGDITANGNITGDSATIISGISTVGATTYYGSGAHLTGIVTSTGISTEGTSTFENIVVDGNAGIGSLNVTGVSTFKNIVYLDTNVSLRFGTNKQIDSTATSLDIQSYGINDINIQSNAGGGTDGDIILKGGTTESLKVNGSGDIIVGSGISVVGVSTFTGITSVTSTHSALYVPQLSSSGVVTATTFSGSGASLTSITNSNLSGSAGITNANLANSTVSYGGVSLALGASDATPAFDLTDATNYPYTSLTGVTTDILGDSSPQLGGDLDLNSKDITGSGNIDVTGALKVSGISTFVSAVGISSDLTLTNTDGGSAAGPEFNLERLSGSPDDADYLGQINFKGKQDGGGTVNYAKITGKILDASNGSEDGILEFMLRKAGSNNIAARFRSDSLQLLNGTAFSVAGDITANGNINGDGSTNITGINAITAAGDITANGNIVGDSSTNISGINSVTATTFYGDGSGLSNTGISTTVLKSDPQHNLYAGTGTGTDSDADTCYNIGIGYSAGHTNCAGDSNVFIGCYAGNKLESGSDNIFLGKAAGCSVTTGQRNIILGCGGKTLTTGPNNILIGAGIGQEGTMGNTNDTVAIGHFAGCCLTDGHYNLLLGSFAGRKTQSGCRNIFLGHYVATNHTTGHFNIALGTCMDMLSATDSHQLLIGCKDKHWIVGNGNWNIGIGTDYPDASVGAGVTAKLSVGIVSAYQLYGDGSNLSNVGFSPDADQNLVAGTDAGEDLDGSSGCFNVLIGCSAGKNMTSGAENIALGHKAMGSGTVTGDSNIVLGESAGHTLTSGHHNLLVGDCAGTRLTTTSYNALFGINAGQSMRGDYNVAFGGGALAGAWGGHATNTGSCNIALGKSPGSGMTTGNNNIMLGCRTAYNITTGSDNFIVGQNAAACGTLTGSYNVVFGYESGCALTSGATHILIGKYAGKGLGGSQDNIFMGKYSGCATSGGSYNVAIGANTMIGTGNKTGNTSLGRFAGCTITDGAYNTFLGYGAGHHTTTGDYNIAIGCAVCLSANSASNELAIGCGTKRWICGDSNFNVGIGTNPADAVGSATTSKLSVGIVSAYQLYGDGSNLTGTGFTQDDEGNLVAGTGAGAAKDADTCNNIMIGCNAGAALNAGDCNILLGINAGKAMTDNLYNTAIGGDTFCLLATGFNNIAMGFIAGRGLTTGCCNLFYGAYSGFQALTAHNNVGLGAHTLKRVGCCGAGLRNTAIGDIAGCQMTCGCDNTFLGHGAGASTKRGSNNIMIGCCVQNAADDDSCYMAIGIGTYHWIDGNANFNVGIGTTNPDIAVGAGNTAKLSVGIVSAYQLYGDGSNLTNVSAAATDAWAPDSQQNLVAGTGAGAARDADTCFNIMIGCKAGQDLNAGDRNILIGLQAGESLTTGGNNIYMGAFAGGDKTVGDYNIALGLSAGKANEGSCNVFAGKYAGRDNTTGNYNVFLGLDAGKTVTTGGSNVVIGKYAMSAGVTTGDGNIAIGENTLPALVAGACNIALGCKSSYGITSGTNNISLGRQSLMVNQTGQDNVAIGHQAGYYNHRSYNVFIGHAAGKGSSAYYAYNNVAIGSSVNVPVVGGDNQLAIGAAANTWIVGNANWNVGIGTTNPDITVGAGNTAKLSVGILSAYQLYGDGSNLSNVGFSPDDEGNLVAGTLAGTNKDADTLQNIFLGCKAGCCVNSGDQNIFLGCKAGQYTTGGSHNIGIGAETLGLNQPGDYNIALGYLAGRAPSSTTNNIWIGKCVAAENAVTGIENIAIGCHAMCKASSGAENIAIGREAMGAANVTGSANIVMGSYAGLKFTSANNNVVLGNYAMRNGTDVSATNSVVIGTNAGRNLTSAQSNVLIGNSAGCTLSTTHGNTFLGHQAGCLATGASNVFIGKYTSCSQTAGDRNIVIGCRANLPVLDGSDQILLKAANTFFYGCCNGGCTLVGIGTTGPNDVVGVGVTSKLSVGIVSAYQLYGDGSNLSNVGFTQDSNCNLIAGKDAGTCAGNSPSTFNIIIGCGTGCLNGDGEHNVLLGTHSGKCVTGGERNVLIGMCAGTCVNDGKCNVFIGNYTGANQYCSNNIAIGCKALLGSATASDNTGTGNIALGQLAMSTGAITGTDNIAIGLYAGADITSGKENVFLGKCAGCNTTTGCYNIAFGKLALGDGIVTGTNNIALGCQAAQKLTSGISNVIIGLNAAAAAAITGYNNIILGKNSLGCLTSGHSNFTGGYRAGKCLTTGDYNIFLGSDAGRGDGAAVTGDHNFGGGYKAGYSLTSGASNVLIGRNAGDAVTTGSNHVAIGYNALSAEDTLSGSVAIGYEALKLQNGGDSNTAIGCGAGAAVVTGTENVFIGKEAGENITGSNNSIIGAQAMSSASSGSSNVAIGQDAGRNNTGDNNVIIGATAGDASGAGEQNVFVGRNSGSAVTDGQSNTFIGMNAGNSTTDGNGNVMIGANVCLANGNCSFAIGRGTSYWIQGDSSFNTTVNTICASNFNSTSDIRLKTNIQPIGDPIGKVKQIEGVSFNWKKDNKPALGVIADQVEKILPELVHGDDPKTVNYNGLIGLLIETVKEQQNQIDELNDRISKLE